MNDLTEENNEAAGKEYQGMTAIEAIDNLHLAYKYLTRAGIQKPSNIVAHNFTHDSFLLNCCLSYAHNTCNLIHEAYPEETSYTFFNEYLDNHTDGSTDKNMISDLDKAAKLLESIPNQFIGTPSKPLNLKSKLSSYIININNIKEKINKSMPTPALPESAFTVN